MRISQGVRHSLITASVVLAAPMSMAAASIEGSPLRDAIRAPFEGLGLVSAEGRGDEPALEPAAESPGRPASDTDEAGTSGDFRAAGSVGGAGAGSDAAPPTPPEDRAPAPPAPAPAAAPPEPTADADSDTTAGADEPESPPAEPEPILDEVLGDAVNLMPDALEGLP